MQQSVYLAHSPRCFLQDDNDDWDGKIAFIEQKSQGNQVALNFVVEAGKRASIGLTIIGRDGDSVDKSRALQAARVVVAEYSTLADQCALAGKQVVYLRRPGFDEVDAMMPLPARAGWANVAWCDETTFGERLEAALARGQAVDRFHSPAGIRIDDLARFLDGFG